MRVICASTYEEYFGQTVFCYQIKNVGDLAQGLPLTNMHIDYVNQTVARWRQHQQGACSKLVIYRLVLLLPKLVHIHNTLSINLCCYL